MALLAQATFAPFKFISVDGATRGTLPVVTSDLNVLQAISWSSNWKFFAPMRHHTDTANLDVNRVPSLAPSTEPRPMRELVFRAIDLLFLRTSEGHAYTRAVAKGTSTSAMTAI